MLLKKWSYLVLVAWLINTLVCFHPTSYYQGNTVISTFFQVAKKSNEQPPKKKVSSRIRFVAPRDIVINLQLPFTADFKFLAAGSVIAVNRLVFWHNKVFLSPFYHFLFRLSPF